MNNFFLIVLLFSLSKSLAQRCGQGTLELSIYTLNGKEIKEFDYEIFPVNKDLLEENYYKKILGSANYDEQKRELLGKFWNGVIFAEVFMNNIIDSREEALDDLQKKLLKTKLSKKGKIKNSFKLHTWEGLFYPVIIKLSNNGKTHYLLGNFFGGCNREVSVIWLDGNQIRIGDF